MGEGRKRAFHFAVKGSVFLMTTVPHAVSKGEGEDRALASRRTDDLFGAQCLDN